MLFLNKEIEGDIQDHLDARYGRDKSKKALDELRTLEAVVFAPVSSQLDKVDFSVTADQLKAFFGDQLDEEFARLKNGEFDPTLTHILHDPNGQALMRSLLTQFSIEFLIEGAPMGLYATGAFGTLQSHLLRVYQDEMGNGVPEDVSGLVRQQTRPAKRVARQQDRGGGRCGVWLSARQVDDRDAAGNGELTH